MVVVRGMPLTSMISLIRIMAVAGVAVVSVAVFLAMPRARMSTMPIRGVAVTRMGTISDGEGEMDAAHRHMPL